MIRGGLSSKFGQKCVDGFDAKGKILLLLGEGKTHWGKAGRKGEKSVATDLGDARKIRGEKQGKQIEKKR